MTDGPACPQPPKEGFFLTAKTSLKTAKGPPNTSKQNNIFFLKEKSSAQQNIITAKIFTTKISQPKILKLYNVAKIPTNSQIPQTTKGGKKSGKKQTKTKMSRSQLPTIPTKARWPPKAKTTQNKTCLVGGWGHMFFFTLFLIVVQLLWYGSTADAYVMNWHISGALLLYHMSSLPLPSRFTDHPIHHPSSRLLRKKIRLKRGVPSHPVPSYPIPSHPVPSHPVSSRPHLERVLIYFSSQRRYWYKTRFQAVRRWKNRKRKNSPKRPICISDNPYHQYHQSPPPPQ